jgi:hypothetical protein
MLVVRHSVVGFECLSMVDSWLGIVHPAVVGTF